MNLQRLNDWLQVVGVFAVLAGLVLVAYEVRQNSKLVGSELRAVYLTNWMEADRMRTDSEFAATWAKALESPSELTTAELVQLDGYMWGAVALLQLDQELFDVGLFDQRPQQVADSFAAFFLGSQYAQVWWENNKHREFQERVDRVDRALQEISADADVSIHRRIKSQLSAE